MIILETSQKTNHIFMILNYIYRKSLKICKILFEKICILIFTLLNASNNNYTKTDANEILEKFK